MVKIPSFNSSTPVRAMPGVRQSTAGASPAAFGAEAGAALSSIGREMSQMGIEIKSREDAVAAKSAYVTASDKLRDYLHNPDTGAYAKLGVGAKGLADSATNDIERIKNESAKNLSPTQRQSFEQFFAAQRDSALTGVSRHEFTQMKEYETNLNTAIVTGAEEDMVTRREDPEAMDVAHNVAVATIRSQLRGQGEDVINRAVEASNSRSYGAVIARYLVDGRTEDAKQLLDKHGDKMNSKVKLSLEAEIKQKSIEMFAVAKADAMAPYGMSSENEGKVLSDLNKQYQAGEMKFSEYQAAEKAIQSRFSDLSRVEQRESKAQFEEGATAIRNTPGFAAGEKLARQAKDPMVIDNLLRFNQIWNKEEYERTQTNKAISNQISAQNAADKREDSRAIEMQTDYETALKAVGMDETKLPEYISQNFQGKKEEDLLRFSHNRDILSASKQSPDATPPAIKEILVSEAATKTRAWVDERNRLGTKVTANEASGYYLNQVGPAATQHVTRENIQSVMDYAAGNGVTQFVTQDRVADVLDMVVPPSKNDRDPGSGVRRLEKYRGLYDAVVRRIGSTDKAIPVDVLRPIVAEYVGMYNKKSSYLPTFIVGENNVLIDLAKAQDNRILVVRNAFGEALSQDQEMFLMLVENSGVNLNKETPESLKAGFLKYLAKKKGAK